MRSKQLIKLERRYRYLRRRYLPRTFSRTGSYTEDQFTDAIAFRVLFHAELETHIESLALSYLEKIDVHVRSGSTCKGSSAIMSLYRADTMGGAPMQFSEFENRPYLKRCQLACINELRRKIDSNRGIKSHNLLSMFVPLGIDETSIEEQLIIDLNTFGARRGDVAHKGITAITALPDPREEKLLAERIVSALAAFEELLPPIAE